MKFLIIILLVSGVLLQVADVHSRPPKSDERKNDLSYDKIPNNQNIQEPFSSEYPWEEQTDINDPIREQRVKSRKPRSAVLRISSYSFNTLNSTSCADSSDDFPNFFTQDQIKKGALIMVIIVGTYCFIFLAIICDKYFLPCMETICEVLNLSQDIAAATFMSIATSTPELFDNLIGTFITESDIGIGTVVGSSLFNALGVAALGGLAAVKPIQLDWIPLTRDVIIYILAICLLISITWDGMIFWYEALTLFIVYFFYFTLLWNYARIMRLVRKYFNIFKSDEQSVPEFSQNSKTSKKISVSHYGSYIEEPHPPLPEIIESKSEEEQKETDQIFKFPREAKLLDKLMWLYTLPIKFILFCLIPSPKLYPKLFPLTFIMCVLFIGGCSYIVSWMITIIGATFGIPHAILGLTFLAAGGCLPESISITIMSRRGEGSMGVSNSLGANTMNILMSLGMPWFLKTLSMGANSESFIRIESGSIRYTILALIAVAIILFLTLFFNKFQLRKRVGTILAVTYILCLSGAIASEMLVKSHCRKDQ